ncbi:hypothetical protein BASA50_007923 [Batrachochytrium salamandrivorans]|uniref:ADP-ribosylation factor-like protein 2-binding protein n=1 Tax=Batrachochytrium salamandrivorans TaxID=1357716 RepID=A0ABQ8F5J2_9FUNG|nr:hypothetical protein BASA62_003269 [Batrachochytrium salamandrivorans]KAH6577564.1 hypothetical protein BASA60_003970 [Batrachochytrium salamandrivorans]KAH6584420.1 hypothetical protein BASA61_007472 [Batrachochytrium salamandrivorans]KAH6592635.1 hypothetical protein BASA50_007923 [Batrachochytrium salamandrivorans]KAH9247565.1 hypothetical protein BASA81_014821 [Batrachochytrium salamandrivorans]
MSMATSTRSDTRATSSKSSSPFIELGTFEEDLASESPTNAEDAKFDAVVGVMEDIIMDDKFVSQQEAFLLKHYMAFDHSEENKLEYMDIFQAYTVFIETILCKQLKKRLPWFRMPDFLEMIRNRPEQAQGDVFDILHSLGDFSEFKDLMIRFKCEKEGNGLGLDCCLSISSAQSFSR